MTGSANGPVILLSPNRQLIHLCREYEVAFGQAVDFVGPQRQLYLSPRKVNVGMVVPLLGQFADAVREIKRSTEVLKIVFPLQVMPANDAPIAAQLSCHIFQLIACKWLNATFAGNTFFL